MTISEQEAAAPSEEPVAWVFGEGKLVIDTGTAHGMPAVFIAPAKMPGEVGASAAREGHDLHSLQPGEIVLAFPTDAHARAVADALVASPAVAPVAVSVKTVDAIMEDIWAMARCSSPTDRQYWAGNLRETLSSIIPATKGGEDAVEAMAHALHALACYDSAEDYRREKQPVPEKFADPWLPTGIRQLEILRKRAAVLLAALSAQDTDGVAKPGLLASSTGKETP